MGQEQSSLISDKTPCQTLRDRSVESIARYINNGRSKKIVVMVGAGISTSAGIPDFRSPDTGLYANLAKLNLPFAEAVFDISYFRSNPLPFYTLAHELYPGKYKPTISHTFIRLLSDKGVLLKMFTQNIDCLEREAGIPEDKIVEAHGSFAHHHCIECKSSYPEALMKTAISKAEVPHCLTPQCNGLVKPDIVFFGEQLPEEFHKNRTLPSAADLCIVMGTSLSVQPFASLPSFCEEGVPRVLVNLERVGGFGSRADDVLILGDCDAGVRKLVTALGWESDLENLRNGSTSNKEADDDARNLPATPKTKEQRIDDEITTITKEIDKSLKISSEHEAKTRSQLAREDGEAANVKEAGQSSRVTNSAKPASTSQADNLVPVDDPERPEGAAVNSKAAETSVNDIENTSS